MYVEVAGYIRGNSIARTEPEDYAILNVHRFCSGVYDANTIDAITKTINGKSANRDHVSRGGIDDDPIYQGGQDRSKRAGAIERD